MITQVQKLKFQTHNAAVVVNACDENSRKFYHIIKMNEAGMRKLDEDVKKKRKADFKEYGEILFSGWGEEPSAETMLELKKLLEA